jgi:hypothetical protein
VQQKYEAGAGSGVGLLRAATWLVPAVEPPAGTEAGELRDYLRSVWDSPTWWQRWASSSVLTLRPHSFVR